MPRITPNLEIELGKEYRVNFAAKKIPVETRVARKDQEMSANFGSVLKMFKKIEGKKEKSPKSEENVKKEEILSKERRKFPKSVKTPRKCLVKPKNASSGSKNRHGFTGSGLANVKSNGSGKKTPKKRSTSVAATVQPFKRGKVKTSEDGKVRKIITFFEKKEASKFSKFYSGGEKVYEHNTANSNFKDGAKLENKTETGSEQLGSHSTNHYHTMGTAIQTDAPTSIRDYRGQLYRQKRKD